MDSITQAALGAAIGQATLGRKVGAKGAIAGAIVATIPDLDVALRFFYTSYDMLRIHRGLSHSLLFGILGAVLIAFLMQRIRYFREVNFQRLWIFSGLCLVTHGLLDYCTSYGTQLFLPFSDARLGLDTVNVVDPVYTVPLLVGSLGGLLIPRMRQDMYRWNRLGLIVSTLYLVFTFGLKQRINGMLQNDLLANDIESQTQLTMPVGMASIYWYGVAKTTEGLYMKKYSVLGSEGELVFFPSNEPALQKLNPEVAATMRWFAKGFYTAEEDGDTIRIYNLQVDMRGMALDRTPAAPTKGFFEFIKKENGEFGYGYGSL